MQELTDFVKSTLSGMAVAGLAAGATFVALGLFMRALRHALLSRRQFPFEGDQYLNREYAKPEERGHKTAAA